MKSGLTIGELAKGLRLNPKTIRYYEEMGLLPESRRSESGYRVYSGDDVKRLALIRRAKLLGLSLTEIKDIVEFAFDRRCDDLGGRLLALLEAKLGEIDQKIEDLTLFRENLRQYYGELSVRLKSEERRECSPPDTAPCQCIGEEVDGFGK